MVVVIVTAVVAHVRVCVFACLRVRARARASVRVRVWVVGGGGGGGECNVYIVSLKSNSARWNLAKFVRRVFHATMRPSHSLTRAACLHDPSSSTLLYCVSLLLTNLLPLSASPSMWQSLCPTLMRKTCSTCRAGICETGQPLRCWRDSQKP